MFSGSFSAAFSGVGSGVDVGQYVGPMMAQRLLADGAAWSVSGSSLLVAGAVLIGPAGKTFVFSTPEAAARWVENAKNIGRRERSLIASIEAAAAAIWKAEKREKLTVIAGRVIEAAARQHDADKRAALIAEADYCLTKWGV